MAVRTQERGWHVQVVEFRTRIALVAIAHIRGLLALAALIATFSSGIRTMRPFDDLPHSR